MSSSQCAPTPTPPTKPAAAAAAAAAAAQQWSGYVRWQRHRGGKHQHNDNQSLHYKQLLLLLCSVGMIITGSAPTLLVPNYCPPSTQQAEWHDCPLVILITSSAPAHAALLACNAVCAAACCWLLLLVYKRDDWINTYGSDKCMVDSLL